MKIDKIRIQNYRLFKDFTLDVEENLTLIVGKNNTGKTSVLKILDQFINKGSFFYDDLNNRLKSLIYDNLDGFLNLDNPAISLSIFIRYDEKDNLSNIRYLMQDLNPNNKFVILNFRYGLDELSFEKLKKDFNQFLKEKEIQNSAKSFDVFLRKYFSKYFKTSVNSVLYDINNNDADWSTTTKIDLKAENIREIINFKYIDAKRLVSNEKDTVLSELSYKFYQKMKEESEIQNSEDISSEAEKDDQDFLIQLEKQVNETDENLTNIYKELFQSIIEKAKRFGGIKTGETILEILSELKYESLLSNNISVMYKDYEYSLPENYNGLGYLNLLSIIFEIESQLLDFKRPKNRMNIPSDINLFFIEEPEAHTHPQMQYVFIKNIKEILKEEMFDMDEKPLLSLQTIMTTHSSHIVSGGEFNDIKYFHKVSDGESSYVISKNLKELEVKYKKEKNYPLFPDIVDAKKIEEIGTNQFKFLKQYLTLNRAEIFFADKVVLIEGDTERILIPAMMKKLDNKATDKGTLPLLSQNISIIEAGAHSHIFDNFLSFIGIKTLIITDIDFAKIGVEADGKERLVAANPEDTPTHTTNSAIKHFHKNQFAQLHDKDIEIDLEYVKSNNFKPLSTKSGNWVIDDKNGNLLLVWQCEEENNYKRIYYARSFEDSFIHMNLDFIYENYQSFASLKPANSKRYIEVIENKAENIDSFKFSTEMINKNGKPSFAMDILLHSDEDYSNWNIPQYIKEGLLWLKKD